MYAGSPRPFRVRDVRAEALVPEVAALLLAAREPAGVAPRAFAQTRGLEAEEVTALVLEFAREGVLEPAP